MRTNLRKKTEKQPLPDIVYLDIKGIKCDAEGCGWANMSVPLADYKLWVNAECPNCGECVLTEKAHKHVKKLLRRVDLINAVGRVFQRWGWIKPNSENKVQYRALHDNKGNPAGWEKVDAK